MVAEVRGRDKFVQAHVDVIVDGLDRLKVAARILNEPGRLSSRGLIQLVPRPTCAKGDRN